MTADVLDLDAIASRPGDGAIFLSNWERDALVAEVRRLRAIEDAARAVVITWDAECGCRDVDRSRLLTALEDR